MPFEGHNRPIRPNWSKALKWALIIWFCSLVWWGFQEIMMGMLT